jgi:hypothetical protein
VRIALDASRTCKEQRRAVIFREHPISETTYQRLTSKSENTEAPDVRTLPDLEAEDQRLKQVGRSCRLEDERCDADIDHRTNGRVFVLCDARFRGVMNWTIGEERFQPF